LTPDAKAAAKALLEEFEGRRAKPYRCSEGFLSVGVGHNLDSKGLPNHIIDALFEHDWQEAEAGAEGLPGYQAADDVRRGVLVRMVYQLGLGGVLKFKRFLAHFAAGAYEAASKEMLRSKWAEQTKTRAEREAQIMATGRLTPT